MKSPTLERALADEPGRRDGLPGGEGRLQVYVVATTLPLTRIALRAADGYAHGFGVRIVLLVPRVVPYPELLAHRPDATGIIADRFRQTAEELGIEASIRVCVCRPHSAALTDLLPEDTIVVVGGRSRRWWHTREQRLARALARDGRRVLLVPGPHPG
jgi:hypothetical protein